MFNNPVNYHLEFKVTTDNSFSLIQHDFISSNKNLNYVELPIHLKVRTTRHNNFDAYLITGVNPKLNLSYKTGIWFISDNDYHFQLRGGDFLHLKMCDLSFDVGAGVDFYGKVSKFALEAKASFGMPDVLYPFGSIQDMAISSVKTKVFVISLLVE